MPCLRSPWTSACCSRTRSERRPDRRGPAGASGASSAMSGTVTASELSSCGSRSRARWRTTAFSTASARFFLFSEPSSLGKGEGTVAADHLDTGMVGEPFGHGRYVPVGQQIHGAPRFDVHQDGGIDMPLAQRELVHPEHSRRVRCRFGQALDRRPATAPRRPPLRDPGGRCQRRPPQRDRRRSPQGDLLPRRRPTRRLPGEVHFTDIEHLEFDL